jgi:hypothetical protein
MLHCSPPASYTSVSLTLATTQDSADVLAFWLEVNIHKAWLLDRWKLIIRGPCGLTHQLSPLHLWLATRGHSRNLHRYQVRQPETEIGEDQIRHQW